VKFRVLFAACATAAAVVSTAAVAAATPNGAAPGTAGAGPAASAPAPVVINLKGGFPRAVLHAVAEARAGIVPTTRARFTKAARAAVSCAEPDCGLVYNGGPVQHSPRIYLLLWGPKWTFSDPAYKILDAFYRGLGVPARDSWSATTVQYGDSGGRPGFTGGELVGAYKDPSAPQSNVTPDDLAVEADKFVSKQHIGDLADAQIVVASQSGTCFSDGFAGSCGTPTTSTTAYCAWHTVSGNGVPFTNLPYQLDAQDLCGENWINGGTAGKYDGFTTVGGHEYAETVTDPQPDTGWIDLSDNVSGGEIGDKCAWGGQPFGLSDPDGDITLATGKFAVQSLWSNAADGCVMSTVPQLAVTSPGAQKAVLGNAVSLQVHASSSPGTALVYTAAGLPGGLAISRLTGRITGTPGTTAGTFTTTVTVADVASSRKVTFTWQVASVRGPVKGFGAKCADDANGSTANGNKIDQWACTGKTPQAILFAASGELQVVGKCITAGTAAILQPCTGGAAQTWTRRANGEYVIKSAGLCLTDPNSSTANGTQLRLSACTNAADQRWSLP